MSENLLENLMKQYLIQTQIPNKNDLLFDILEIQNNMTGRIGSSVANSFILESSQLLVNSIFLFERGFFDCAYYSLRQALELSTTMVYLSDMPVETRKQKLKDWNNNKDFPMQSPMLNELKEKGYIFSDMKQKMPRFFKELYDVSRKLNKIVHKQGYRQFYRYRTFHILDEKQNIDDFLFFLRKAIGIVAVMRLSIDPFPILLLDDEIYHRSFESISDAYSKEFISKYIEKNTVEEYKQTKLFQETYNHIMKSEKRDACVYDIVWNQYINLQQQEKILKQIYLISEVDQIAVLLAFMCKNTLSIHTYGGLRFYITSLTSQDSIINNVRSSSDFDNYCNSSVKYNQPFHNSYLSVFKYKDEDFVVIHLTPISEQELNYINEKLHKISK